MKLLVLNGACLISEVISGDHDLVLVLFVLDVIFLHNYISFNSLVLG